MIHRATLPCICALATIACAQPSVAETLFFLPSEQQGDWSDDANWFTSSTGLCSNLDGGGNVPTEADIVVICGDKIALVTDEGAEAYTVNVNGPADIRITPTSESAATLTLGGDPDEFAVLTSEIFGDIILGESVGNNHATLTFNTNHHIFDGNTAGCIIGQGDNASIELPIENRGISLYLITLRGKCKVTGVGILYNAGLVQADSNGTLLIDISGELTDELDPVPPLGAPTWRATNPPSGTAILRFGSNIQDLGVHFELVGDFQIDDADAKIQIDNLPDLLFGFDFATNGELTMTAGVFDVQNDTTVGALDMSGGKIVVAAARTFTAD